MKLPRAGKIPARGERRVSYADSDISCPWKAPGQSQGADIPKQAYWQEYEYNAGADGVV